MSWRLSEICGLRPVGSLTSVPEDLAALEKDYKEVGAETAEGEGEEAGYGDVV